MSNVTDFAAAQQAIHEKRKLQLQIAYGLGLKHAEEGGDLLHPDEIEGEVEKTLLAMREKGGL